MKVDVKIGPSELAELVTDYLNTFNDEEKCNKFNYAMSRKHRTLQQNFTKLCLRWIEHVASDDYRFDDRNEDSHITCKKLIDLYRNLKSNEGYTNQTLDLVSKPSNNLRYI